MNTFSPLVKEGLAVSPQTANSRKVITHQGRKVFPIISSDGLTSFSTLFFIPSYRYNHKFKQEVKNDN